MCSHTNHAPLTWVTRLLTQTFRDSSHFVYTDATRSHTEIPPEQMNVRISPSIFLIFVHYTIKHLFRTAALLVSEAIKDSLTTFPMILSIQGISRPGMRGVLMLDAAAGDVGGRGVVGGSVLRESPNLSLEMRFVEGILIWFY